MSDNYKFWKKIWDIKGSSESQDLLYLDGYDHLSYKFDSKQIARSILEQLGARKNDSILEVACGAGFLAREMQSLHYTGVDYSEPIILKHKNIFPHHNVLVSESNTLPFEDNRFDYVFCFGLFQYLPNREYAEKTIAEMNRVCRKKMFLGDLKSEKTRNTHFVYPLDILVNTGYIITKCLYDKEDETRYNALRNI
tara:strand:+ start:3308 stop:3892 length:585 start_codon:yes stop_codon:yes gene_type:complete